MKSKEFKLGVQKLAAEAGLRRLALRQPPGDCWVGVYRGIVVMLHLDAVRLRVELLSPEDASAEVESAEVESGEVESVEAAETEKAEAEDNGVREQRESREECDDSSTSDFHRTQQAGIPAAWFVQNDVGPWGFELIVDSERREQLADHALDGVLNCIVEDLHDLGAEQQQPCSTCDAEAETVGYFQDPVSPTLAPFCDCCWEEAKQASGGAIRVSAPSYYLVSLTFLAVASVLFAGVWGFAQHPNVRLPLPILLFGCGVAGFMLAMKTAEIARGSNLVLRLAIVTAVVLATLAGNILGVKLALDAQAVSVPLLDLAPIYFTEYFPANLGEELTYLSGGVIGVLVSFFTLRATERVRLL
ncbi:MAG: hypothetical protein RIC55_26695 [Pirellulaceae bacterium]